MSVVYAIKNLINNKIYIGSSKSPTKRKYAHFYSLKKGNHHSQHLQRSYDKYGREKFSFYILEECSDVERLFKEREYIDRFKSYDRDFGYNIFEPDGDKFSCSQETKDKISSTKKNKIAVDLYHISGVFIKSFDSVADCSNYFGCKYKSPFVAVLNGRRKSYKDHCVVLKGEPLKYKYSSKKRNMLKFYKE